MSVDRDEGRLVRCAHDLYGFIGVELKRAGDEWRRRVERKPYRDEHDRGTQHKPHGARKISLSPRVRNTPQLPDEAERGGPETPGQRAHRPVLRGRAVEGPGTCFRARKNGLTFAFGFARSTVPQPVDDLLAQVRIWACSADHKWP